MAEDTHVWFAGIDWGSQKHQTCVLDAQGTIIGEQEFPHSGKGLAELSDWILSITGSADAVAVGIEVPHGPVVDALLDRGFAVYAINPKRLGYLVPRALGEGADTGQREISAQVNCRALA